MDLPGSAEELSLLVGGLGLGYAGRPPHVAGLPPAADPDPTLKSAPRSSRLAREVHNFMEPEDRVRTAPPPPYDGVEPGQQPAPGGGEAHTAPRRPAPAWRRQRGLQWRFWTYTTRHGGRRGKMRVTPKGSWATSTTRYSAVPQQVLHRRR